MKRVDAIFQESGYEPRPYQRRIVEDVVKMFTGQYVNGAKELERAVESVMIE